MLNAQEVKKKREIEGVGFGKRCSREGRPSGQARGTNSVRLQLSRTIDLILILIHILPSEKDEVTFLEGLLGEGTRVLRIRRKALHPSRIAENVAIRGDGRLNELGIGDDVLETRQRVGLQTALQRARGFSIGALLGPRTRRLVLRVVTVVISLTLLRILLLGLYGTR